MEEVIEINPKDVKARLISFNEKHKFDPVAFFQFSNFLRKENIDILHLHLPYSQTIGRLAAKISGTEYVISTHHNMPQSHHPITRYSEFITRRLDNFTITVSHGIREANLSSNNNCLSGRDTNWYTIYNTIDAAEFSQRVDEADASKIESASEYNPVLLNVSRYVEQKSHTDLILAMKYIIDEFPDAHLYFVGRGPLEQQLRNEINQQRLDDHITVTGYVTQEQLFRYYSLADLFVLSSIREGFGIVLIEAMTAKLPIVATDIPGVNEVVNDGVTGKLVDKNTPKQIADAVQTIQKEGLEEEYGVNGYTRALNKFSVENSVFEYKSLYRKMYDN